MFSHTGPMTSYTYVPDTMVFFPDFGAGLWYAYQPTPAEIAAANELRNAQEASTARNLVAYNHYLDALKTILPETSELYTYFQDPTLRPLLANRSFDGIKFGMDSGRIQNTPFQTLMYNLAKLANEMPEDKTSALYAINHSIVMNSLLLVKEMNDANIKKNGGSLDCDSTNTLYWEQVLDLCKTVAAIIEVNRNPQDAEKCDHLSKMIATIYNPKETRSTALTCLALAAITLAGIALLTLAIVFPVGVWAIFIVTAGMAASIIPSMQLYDTTSQHFNQKKVRQQAQVTTLSLQALSIFSKNQKKEETIVPEQTQDNTQSLTL